MPPFKKIEFLLGAASPKQFPPPDRPEVAIAGRSNVGKSSLLNALAQRRNLARTSKTPGRTREINFFNVDDRFRLVDLPGYGYAKASKSILQNWQRLMSRYLIDRPNLARVIVLLDSRHDPSALDRQLVAMLEAHQVPFAFVLTKADKLSRGAADRQLRRVREIFPGREVVASSALKRLGLAELWGLIRDAVEAR